MPLARKYTLAWVIWLAMFGAIEGSALLNKKRGDTLTEHVRKWAAVGNKPKGWRLRRFTLLTLLAWMAGHFLTDDEF